MNDVLLDTDVFSFFFKRDSRAELYAPLLQGCSPCLCFMSVAEIKRWAIQRGWGAPRRAALTEALRHYVILPFDAALTKLSSLYAQEGKDLHPVNLALTAMSHFQLHHPDESRAAFAQLRAVMSDPANADTWAKDTDAQALLKEAEALIDPQPAAKP